MVLASAAIVMGNHLPGCRPEKKENAGRNIVIIEIEASVWMCRLRVTAVYHFER
jgi:hypothetical protein